MLPDALASMSTHDEPPVCWGGVPMNVMAGSCPICIEREGKG
jgi:hypothetical protein